MTQTELAEETKIIEQSRSELLSSVWAVPLAYLLALAVAEALITLSAPQVGMVLYGLILMALLLQASLSSQKGEYRFLVALALLPLIRVLSLSLPLSHFPPIYWYAVIGSPLFIAVFTVARLTGRKRNMIVLRLSPRALSIQLLIGLSGILLGYIEYLILRPGPLVAELSLKQVWLPILILLVFTGLLEELIFRGVLQTTAIEQLGRLGILYVAIVCTVLHLGYSSLLDIFFVFAVALLFGLLTFRTGSLLGVSLSHGLTNVVLYLVFPFLLVTPTSQVLPPADILSTEESNPVQAISSPTQLKSPIPSPSKPPIFSETTAPSIASPHLDEIWPQDEETTLTQCGSHLDWVVYIVQPGENLARLSARYGVSIEELRFSNCFEINDQVHAGQGMFVPFDLPSSPPPSSTPIFRSQLPTATHTPTRRPKKKPTPTHTQTPTPLPTPSSTLPPVKPRNTPTLAPTQPPGDLLTPTPTHGD